MEQDQEVNRLDETSGASIPTVIETVLSQMEQRSILSNVINYIQHDKHPKNFHDLNISAVNKEKYKRNSNIEKEERYMLELDFGDTP